MVNLLDDDKPPLLLKKAVKLVNQPTNQNIVHSSYNTCRVHQYEKRFGNAKAAQVQTFQQGKKKLEKSSRPVGPKTDRYKWSDTGSP